MLNEAPSKQLQGMKRSKKKVVIDPNEVIPDSVRRTKTKVKKEEPPKKIGTVAAIVENFVNILTLALRKAESHVNGYQVKDMVAIYNAMSESVMPLSVLQTIKYKEFMSEIETCLRTFVETGNLPARKMTVRDVIR